MLIAAFVSGCGGGGSSVASITITGTVLDVVTGTPNPSALVQLGATNVSTLTSTVDGSFSLSIPSGSTQLRVDRRDGSSLFVYNFPPITKSGDVGQLWIGPNKISASGRILDSTSLLPISGATVSLGGVSGVSGSDGTFLITGVPYSATGLFPNLPGTVVAANYIAASFTPGGTAIVNSNLGVGDIGLVPSNNPNPPGAPYNIWGRVSPLAVSPGAAVTLSLNGTAFRTTTVGSDGTYYFWVPAGTYTIAVVKSGYNATPVVATLSATNQVLEEDVTLTH